MHTILECQGHSGLSDVRTAFLDRTLSESFFYIVCMAVVSEQGNTCTFTCPGIVPSRETIEMLQHRRVDFGVYAH